eukprot:749183-Hanusia_phi.AAC.6
MTQGGGCIFPDTPPFSDDPRSIWGDLSYPTYLIAYFDVHPTRSFPTVLQYRHPPRYYPYLSFDTTPSFPNLPHPYCLRSFYTPAMPRSRQARISQFERHAAFSSSITAASSSSSSSLTTLTHMLHPRPHALAVDSHADPLADPRFSIRNLSLCVQVDRTISVTSPDTSAGSLTDSGVMSMARGRTFLALQAAVILFASPSLCFSPSCVKLRSPGKGSSLRAPRPSVMMSVKPEQNVDSFEKRISKLTNTVFSGILGASLILSPAMVPTDSPVSYGGTAYAQGATSSKVTRGAPSVDANKDPESILRLSLPINPKNPIREAQVGCFWQSLLHR